MRTGRRGAWAPVFCFVVAAVVMTAGSKNSPLYPMNDWCDVNCFLTVGRDILDGLVPYRDVYEQKGPVLYFVYAALSVLDRTAYWPVWFLEILCAGSFLVILDKSMALFGVRAEVRMAGVVLAAFVPAACLGFGHGGSVEELFAPLLSGSLYFALKSLKQDRMPRFWECLFVGIAAGVALWSKYTICGFYLGFGLYLVWYWRRLKATGLEFCRSAGGFFTGMGAVTAPVLVYFAANGAVSDLFRVYFYDNIFTYSGIVKTVHADLTITDATFFERVVTAFGTFFVDNWFISAMLVLGIVWLALKRREEPVLFALLVLTAGCGAVTTFVCSVGYFYYGYIYLSYVLFGFLAVDDMVLSRLDRRSGVLTACAAGICGVLCFYMCSPNTYLLKYSLEDVPAYRFAEKIGLGSDASVLYYKSLDCGVVMQAGRPVDEKYFCWLNVDLPEINAFQSHTVRTGSAEYIVTLQKELSDFEPDCAENYTEVMSVDFPYWISDAPVNRVVYRLYERTGGAG